MGVGGWWEVSWRFLVWDKWGFDVNFFWGGGVFLSLRDFDFEFLVRVGVRDGIICFFKKVGFFFLLDFFLFKWLGRIDVECDFFNKVR